MITWERRWAVAAMAAFLTIVGTGSAWSTYSLSFPPASFVILNPDTNVAIGRSSYRVDSTKEGATLRGENGYFDGQTDVEVAHIRLPAGGGLPKLADFDHTFYNADGTILKRSQVDLKTGAATCIDNSGGQTSEQSNVLTIPEDTWAGASIVLPIQTFLRTGDKRVSHPFHAFNCAPGPKIFAIAVEVDPADSIWTAYGAETLRVEVRPDFGLLNLIVGAFVPKLHAWFDPKERLAFVGDEAERYYKGPPIMLVKARDNSPIVAR